MKGEISSTWALALGLHSKTKFGKIVFPVFAVNMLCKGRWALGILKKHSQHVIVMHCALLRTFLIFHAVNVLPAQ